MTHAGERSRPLATRRLAAKAVLLGVVQLTAACAASEPKRNARDLAQADQYPGEWLTQGGDYALRRYSPLARITTENVRGLRVAWTFSTGHVQGHEGAPLVVGNTMYLVSPLPDEAYAIDLTKPPALKWKHTPAVDPWAEGIACCDVVNRGWAYADGKLIYNLLDGRTIALDVDTGKPVWETRLGDVNIGETMTMAPLVVKDKVIVGNSGGELGVRGWIAALDVWTGKLAWKAFTTGPDSDVKITSRTKPFYEKDRGRDLGLTSWGGDGWRHGGATVWGWVSYDPDLDLIYHGTSNPGPWNADQRPGDNKWASSIFARDPDDGSVRWVYQLTPHDMWDYDGVNENILVDLPLGGTTRKTLLHFDRNGYGYTLDRETGEVLVANPFVTLNWSQEFDLASGAPVVDPSKETHQGQTTKDICPSTTGGKDQEPAAYSPRTGLAYIPAVNLCMNYTARAVGYIAGTPYVGAHYPATDNPPGGFKGALIAWDPKLGRQVWSVPDTAYPLYSGVLTTGGNLVFYGTLDGTFRALDARTGAVLWEQNLGSGIVGAPMTYVGPDGQQYVAVLAGVGGIGGVFAKTPKAPPTGGTLYVFRVTSR
jgi:PQQ-dependent dehydrogenase (methanol/ethanol family)